MFVACSELDFCALLASADSQSDLKLDSVFDDADSVSVWGYKENAVRYLNRQTRRQTEIQTGRYVDRQKCRQPDTMYVDKQTLRQEDMQTGRYVDRQTRRQEDMQTGRHVDRQIRRQADYVIVTHIKQSDR